MSRSAAQTVPAPSTGPAAAETAGRSPHLDQSLERAHKLAITQSHATVSAEHLLFALTEDTDALGVLGASTVSVERLRADVSTHLAQVPQEAGAKQVMPSAELLKVLKLAAMAAQQSSRRQIDGAIVLAAMIGDASTPSAGLLRAHGLTFSEVIRVLQGSGAPAAPQTSTVNTPARVAGPTTDDLLSSVRARIKDATPPPVVRKPAAPLAPPPPAVSTEEVSKTAAPAASLPQPASQAMPSAPPVVATVVQAVPAQAPTIAPAPLPPTAPALAPIAPAVVAEAKSITVPPVAATAPPPTQPQTGAPQPVMAPAAAVPAMPPIPAVPTAAREPTQSATPQRLESSTPLPPLLAAAPRMPPPLPSAQQPVAVAPVPPLPLAPSPRDVAVARETAAPQIARAPASVPAPHVPPVALDMRMLINAVPKHLRNGQSEQIEINVPRRSLEIPFAHGHRWPPLRVTTLRLRSADGKAHVELASPESLWIGPPRAHQGADDAVWRWRVTPRQNGGRIKLTLAGAARIVGGEGASAEIPFGEETFEVSVQRRRSRRGLVGLLLFGNLLAVGILAMIMSGRAAELGRAAWGGIRGLFGG